MYQMYVKYWRLFAVVAGMYSSDVRERGSAGGDARAARAVRGSAADSVAAPASAADAAQTGVLAAAGCWRRRRSLPAGLPGGLPGQSSGIVL